MHPGLPLRHCPLCLLPLRFRQPALRLHRNLHLLLGLPLGLLHVPLPRELRHLSLLQRTLRLTLCCGGLLTLGTLTLLDYVRTDCHLGIR